MIHLVLMPLDGVKMSATVHLRYFSDSVSPGLSSSKMMLAIQKRPRECTIWIESMPRENVWLSCSAFRFSYVLHTWPRLPNSSTRLAMLRSKKRVL